MAVEDDWVKGPSNGRHTFSLLVHEIDEASGPTGDEAGEATSKATGKDPREVWRERLPHIQGRHGFVIDLSDFRGRPVEMELRLMSAGKRPPRAAIELRSRP